MPPAQPTRTIIGEPLTPEILVRIGGLTVLPETPRAFRHDSEWVNEYRIHVCHGYVESGNRDVGVLRIERTPLEADPGAILKIRRRIVHDEGDTHVLEAWVRCRKDAVSSLQQWRLRSVFYNRSGREIDLLGCEESGEVSAGRVTVARGDKVKTWQADRPVTADWALFDAVQRLPVEAPEPPEFDMLEELGARREAQSLILADAAHSRLLGRDLRLYRQTGYGLLPLEYWLDGRGRLAVAVMGPRAYILDDSADARVDERLEAIRRRKAARS